MSDTESGDGTDKRGDADAGIPIDADFLDALGIARIPARDPTAGDAAPAAASDTARPANSAASLSDAPTCDAAAGNVAASNDLGNMPTEFGAVDSDTQAGTLWSLTDAAQLRLESIAFESLRHDLADARVESLLRILGWPCSFTCFAIAGTPDSAYSDTRNAISKAVRDLGGGACLIGRRESWCVALVEVRGAATPEVTCTAALSAFGDGQPVCLGPIRRNASGATKAISSVLSALRSAPAVHPLPRPMRADDVLPERALIGEEDARDELYTAVYRSLLSDNADDPTLSTVSAFIQSGGSLDATARELNVHPNTVRYRLKRAAETTGWDATNPRESYVLQTAITLGRIRDARHSG